MFHLFGGPQEDGLTYNGISKEYQNDPELRKVNPSEGKDVEWFNQPHYDLKHEWYISDNLKLNATFLYLEGKGYFDFDGSWASMEYLRLDSVNLEDQYSHNEIQDGSKEFLETVIGTLLKHLDWNNKEPSRTCWNPRFLIRATIVETE